jgi:hypothetical protein
VIVQFVDGDGGEGDESSRHLLPERGDVQDTAADDIQDIHTGVTAADMPRAGVADAAQDVPSILSTFQRQCRFSEHVKMVHDGVSGRA